MKNRFVVAALIVFFVPMTIYADGLFFWSAQPFGTGAQPDGIVDSSESHPGNFEFDAFLYYRPENENIGRLNFEMRFPFCEVVAVDIEFPDIVVTDSPTIVLGTRWSQLPSEVTFAGDTLQVSLAPINFLGGLQLANTGDGQFFDQGYDASAEAFFIGTVRLQGISTEVDYVETFATEDVMGDVEVFPDFIDAELNARPQCVLDPPYGGFSQAFVLPPGNSNIITGSEHCTTFPFYQCDGTVWNRFTAESNGVFTCHTFGSGMNTQLEVYAGSNTTDLIAFNDDAAGSTRSRVSFPIEQGIFYSVRIISNPIQDGNTRLEYEILSGALMGDVDGDGFVNLLDVAPFIDLLTSGDYNPLGDTNSDGEVNLLDVQPFVNLLAGG